MFLDCPFAADESASYCWDGIAGFAVQINIH
jgi:hypothetical protein